MRARFCSLVLVLALGRCYGQDSPASEQEVFIGFGLGIDHGGIGVRFDGRITRNIGMFAGAGYNLAGVGWNAGLHYRILPNKKFCPYATAMYGYNTAVRTTTTGGSYVGGTNYYGPSFGGGVEIQSKPGGHYFRTGLLVPLRSPEAAEAFEHADTKPWPVLITLGYHF